MLWVDVRSNDILLKHRVHVQQPPPPLETAQPVQPLPTEGVLSGRGRQKLAPEVMTAEGSFKLL